MTDLSVHLAGLHLGSPLVLASGVLGTTASSLAMVAQQGAGAVTSKSCGVEARPGHPGPCVLPLEHGLINAVGLSNPGAEATVKELIEYRERSAKPLVASIFGQTIEEFGQVAEIISRARPDVIEVNVSCPNVGSEFGEPFGMDPDACGRIAERVKGSAGGIPVSIKLSAGCPDLGQAARRSVEGGADLLTAINTVGPGMVIDTGVRRPVLHNKVGGLSGPAILPIAVRAVWEIRRAVDVPIIGTGGVTGTDGALQMIMAGASAVGIGTGVMYGGAGLFRKINEGLERFLEVEGLDSLDELIGVAHG